MKTDIRVPSAIAFILFLAMPLPAVAQDRPAPVVEVAAGALLFPDDGETVKEGLFGGAARVYVTPRLSVGPEVAFVSGRTHDHLMLTGNLTYDLLPPANGRPARVTPFVVVGAGLFRTHEEFFDDAVTSSEGAFTAGGGLRARLGDRITVGGEARVGWELHVRVNGFVGIALR
jgi:hypothetical protein